MISEPKTELCLYWDSKHSKLALGFCAFSYYICQISEAPCVAVAAIHIWSWVQGFLGMYRAWKCVRGYIVPGNVFVPCDNIWRLACLYELLTVDYFLHFLFGLDLKQ